MDGSRFGDSGDRQSLLAWLLGLRERGYEIPLGGYNR
jgi:predicted deacetylase